MNDHFGQWVWGNPGSAFNKLSLFQGRGSAKILTKTPFWTPPSGKFWKVTGGVQPS